MTILWTVILHAAYLVLAAVSASFLQTPTFSRILLLVLVPLNAWAELQGGDTHSLGFMPMTALIILTVFGTSASCQHLLSVILNIYEGKGYMLKLEKNYFGREFFLFKQIKFNINTGNFCFVLYLKLFYLLNCVTLSTR